MTELVAIMDAVEKEAGERQGKRTDLELPQNVAEVKKARTERETRTKSAKQAGFGNHETARQAKKVVKDGAPSLVAAVDAGEISVSAAAAISDLPEEEQDAIVGAGAGKVLEAAKGVREVRGKNRKAANIAIAAKAVALPDAKYSCIVCDPPWPVEKIERDARPNQVVFDYPTMKEAELADLAADIKANGLLHPIITDATGKVVIDGRNRLRACEIAGVEPTFEKLTGQDARGFIYSANLQRRQMNKGQAAMLTAMMYPEEKSKGGRGKKSAAVNSLETTEFSRARLEQARQVSRYSTEFARAVIAGDMTLDEALLKVRKAENKIQEVVDEVESEEALALAETARKSAELRSKAPDLADMVSDEKVKAAEAEAKGALDEVESELRVKEAREAADRAERAAMLRPSCHGRLCARHSVLILQVAVAIPGGFRYAGSLPRF